VSPSTLWRCARAVSRLHWCPATCLTTCHVSCLRFSQAYADATSAAATSAVAILWWWRHRRHHPRRRCDDARDAVPHARHALWRNNAHAEHARHAEHAGDDGLAARVARQCAQGPRVCRVQPRGVAVPHVRPPLHRRDAGEPRGVVVWVWYACRSGGRGASSAPF
jgi:fatty-acid desaturase